MFTIISRVAVLGALTLIAACSRQPQELVLSGPTMGTTYTVKIVGTPSKVDADTVRTVLDEVLATIDREMSTYRPDSAISRFNESASTDWIEVPIGLARVVHASRSVSERSGGALDLTIAPIVFAWGFGPGGEPTKLPSEEALAVLREQVGYHRLDVRLDPAALRKHHPRLTVDVNAVAPGYAVDVLATRLAALGLKNFMIDIGGEVLARGRNARGDLWRIAVERPIDLEPTPFKIIALQNESITTSGEYRHYFERDGHRYSHTIDPRSGQPIRSRGSVAVVGASSLEVDAWATVLNVLGPDEGLELAEREDIAAMYVVVDGDTLTARMSSAFHARVRIVEPK